MHIYRCQLDGPVELDKFIEPWSYQKSEEINDISDIGDVEDQVRLIKGISDLLQLRGKLRKNIFVLYSFSGHSELRFPRVWWKIEDLNKCHRKILYSFLIKNREEINDIGDVEDQVKIIKGGDQKSMVQMV